MLRLAGVIWKCVDGMNGCGDGGGLALPRQKEIF